MLDRVADSLSRELPSTLDLTRQGDQELTDQATLRLLDAGPSQQDLIAVEERLAGQVDAPLILQLAVKLARSRLYCREVRRRTRVSVVFAMYREHHRILPADQHPNGEDFLVRKAAQLERLFDSPPCASVSSTLASMLSCSAAFSSARAKRALGFGLRRAESTLSVFCRGLAPETALRNRSASSSVTT